MQFIWAEMTILAAGCPELFPTEIKKAEKYLGAMINPRSTTSTEHIKLRIAKTHPILNQMISRGLAAGKIQRQAVEHIINRAIFPSLTYMLEALPTTPASISQLDYFTANMLKETHGASTGPPLWVIWEESLTPPSLQIKLNQIMLFHRIMNKPDDSLVRNRLGLHKNNFFTQSVKQTLDEWDAQHLIPLLGCGEPKQNLKQDSERGED